MRLPRIGTFRHVLLGVAGSSLVLTVFWQLVLAPLGWPQLQSVLHHFWLSIFVPDTYKAMLMTGFRALCGACLGFFLAIILSILTGRTVIGWSCFFFLLMLLQKIPAIAMIEVLIDSKLGIGFSTTVTLATVVVLTFSWQALHHRLATLNPREVFALRLTGLRGISLFWYGLVPHLGASLGGTARLAMSIATIMVVLGEWKGVWADGTIWQYGLGVEISRVHEVLDWQARVLAYCIWLGVLGIILDNVVLICLSSLRRLLGVDFRR